MNEVKTVVGTLEKIESGDGSIVAVVNVGTKFPVKLKAWTTVYGTTSTAPILAELEGVKPGMKVSATYYEKPYTNKQGVPVTGRNLMGIAIATDSTPVRPPDAAPKSNAAHPDSQIPHPASIPAKTGKEWETVEEKRNSMTWMNAVNNATALYAPLMLEDYKKEIPLDETNMDRHIGNILALASRLHDELVAAMNGVK
jgi:hypothetical protein